jgi:hypothetical protein
MNVKPHFRLKVRRSRTGLIFWHVMLYCRFSRPTTSEYLHSGTAVALAKYI